jgi:phthalate 4,5-dioxygenase reductase component
MTETTAPAPMRLTLLARREVARHIVEFTFAKPDGADLPAFTPGAHVTVLTPAGSRRKYSLVNPPGERGRYVIAVRRDGNGRGGSVSMVDGLAVGAAVPVEPPLNAFGLDATARGYLFIAGGIGITPILGMIRSLVAQGGADAPPFRLIYLTRSAADTAYPDEVTGDAMAAHCTLHHDHGDPAQSFDLWPVLERPVAGTHIYCCGPAGLMDAVRDMSGHWPASAVHFESFAAADTAKFEPDQHFTIVLARSGRHIEVDAGQSALEALHAHGCHIMSSCEAGSCGTCRTTYLSGDVEHRDIVLGDDEKADQIMVCVSRARGGVLELDL